MPSPASDPHCAAALPLRNVVLDVGGVLLEWNPARIAAAVFEAPSVAARARRAIFESTLWLEYDRGDFDDEKAVAVFAEAADVFPAQARRLLEAVRESLTPVPGALEMLDALEAMDLDLFVLSNMPVGTWRVLKARYPALWGRFAGLVLSGRIRSAKPDPAIFEHLLREFDLRAEACVFVDDKPENVDAARGLGFRGVVFESAEACLKEIRRLD